MFSLLVLSMVLTFGCLVRGGFGVLDSVQNQTHLVAIDNQILWQFIDYDSLFLNGDIPRFKVGILFFMQQYCPIFNLFWMDCSSHVIQILFFVLGAHKHLLYHIGLISQSFQTKGESNLFCICFIVNLVCLGCYIDFLKLKNNDLGLVCVSHINLITIVSERKVELLHALTLPTFLTSICQ